MSVGRSIAANYASQLYSSALAIIMVPLYVGYMGVEAYGLVGFYAMMQGWFAILDMGVGATLNREAARCNAGAVEGLALRRLIRAFEGIFVVVGLGGVLALAGSAQLLANGWLQVEQLDLAEVERAIGLMAVIVALRWICGLYRGIVTGLEHIVWLSGFSTVVATLRFLLIVPYLAYVGASPTHFFAYQLVVALLESAVLIGQAYRLLPQKGHRDRIRWTVHPLRGVARFTLSVAFTSTVWVIAMQTDKLILSGLVPLEDYAFYTMAVLVASGITLLSAPVTSAVLPRLTRLHAEGDEVGMRELYRLATQIVGVLVVPVVLVLAFFPVQVIDAWTGNQQIAIRAAPVLTLYAVGNGILAFAGFSYLIQVARGNMNLHLIGNVGFVVIFVPLLFLAVTRFGMVGAGWAWLLANLFPFLVWLPLVHHRFLKGEHLRWLTKDIAAIVLPPFFICLAMAYGATWDMGRFATIGQLAFIYIALVLAAACGSSLLLARMRNCSFVRVP
jgi:O-antigen/teichoic acid export membrane protein